MKEEEEYGKTRRETRKKLCKECEIYRNNWNEKKNELNKKEFKIDDNWKKWKDDIYCNELGQVVNKKRLIGTLNNEGYLMITYNKKKYLIHRIIYETFVGEITNNMVINHINEIKNDNRLENLEMITISENTKKSTIFQRLNKNGLRKPLKCIGWKLNEPENKIEFKSLMEAERNINCCHQSIQRVCEGIYNKTKSKTDNEIWIFKYCLNL
jgi:hypothetical protein